MALQAELLSNLLRQDGNSVEFLASNFKFPRFCSWIGRIPVARTLARAVLIWGKLAVGCKRVDVVHIFAASWLYFFLTVAPAVVVGKLCRKRVVVNYRGGGAREFFERWGWLAGPVLHLAHIVTVPSDFLGKVIRSRFGIRVQT